MTLPVSFLNIIQTLPKVISNHRSSETAPLNLQLKQTPGCKNGEVPTDSGRCIDLKSPATSAPSSLLPRGTVQGVPIGRNALLVPGKNPKSPVNLKITF